MPRPLGSKSPAASIPMKDGTIQPGALDQEDVIACTRQHHRIKHCGATCAVDDIVALYDPSRAALAGWLPADAEFVKMVRHPRIIFDSKVVSAQRVTYIGPLFRIPRADGSCWYWAPLPPGIDRQLGISTTLKQQIIRLLATYSVRAVRHMTLAPRGAVEAVLETLYWYQWEAMRAEGARPSYLAFDAFDAKVKAGKDRPVYHLTASDPANELHWTLALLEKPRVEKTDKTPKLEKALAEEKAVARLAQEILELPFPEAVLAIATDYGDEERRVAEKVIERVQLVCPGFQPKPVVDPFHVQQAFEKAMSRFRVKTWKGITHGKRGKQLKNVSAKDLERVEDIKGAANVLSKMRRRDRAENLAARIRYEAACAAAPELEIANDLLEDLREILEVRRAAEADRLYAAWKEKLADSGLDCFEGQVKNLKKEWVHVRRNFEVREQLDHLSNRELKLGSNVVESINKQARAILDKGGKISIARLEQRLLASQGYIAKAQARAEPTLPARKSPKKAEAVV